MILAGAIGEVRHIHAVGGQGLLNDCSHLFDMMRYVTGDPTAQWVMGNVERKTDRFERDVPIEDRSAGIVQFDNGAVGQLLQELGGRHYQGGIFYGTEGVIELDERKIRLISGGTKGWEELHPDGVEASVGQARELVEWM